VDDLFDADDNIVLPVIRGVNEPIDREQEQPEDEDPAQPTPAQTPKSPQLPTRQNQKQ
jgi:hypothetical protein